MINEWDGCRLGKRYNYIFYNSALELQNVQLGSQSLFSSAKNMLLINNIDRYGNGNKSGYFFINDENRGDWSGLPESMPSTGTILGMRNIYAMNVGAGSENILLEIIEMYPVPGRKYYRFLNYGSWESWTTIKPS